MTKSMYPYSSTTKNFFFSIKSTYEKMSLRGEAEAILKAFGIPRYARNDRELL